MATPICNDLVFEVNNDGVTGDGMASVDVGGTEEGVAEDVVQMMVLMWVVEKRLILMRRGNGIVIEDNHNPSLMDESESKTESDFGIDNPNHVDAGMDYNMYFDSESDYSDRSVDYLSDGEEEVIQLREQKSKAKTLPKNTPITEQVAECGESSIILSPKLKTMPDRPRKKRIRAIHDTNSSYRISRTGTEMTCQNYGEKGHNKARRKKEKVVNPPPPQPLAKKGRPKKTSVEEPHIMDVSDISAFMNVADVEGSNTPEVKVNNVGHVRGSSVMDVRVSGKDNIVQTRREKRVMFIDVGESSVAKVGGSCGDKVVQKRVKVTREIGGLNNSRVKLVQTRGEELAEYINSPSWNYLTFYEDDEEHSVQYKEYLEESPDAIAPILSTKEPKYSLSMGYKHLNTTPKTESNEIIKSGVEELVPIPNEYEVTSEDKRECDVLVCGDSSTFDVCNDHSEILSHSNNDDILSNDDVFEDIEYVEATPLDPELVSLEEENDVYQEEEEFNLDDIQDVILREKLLSINLLNANIESLNDNPTPDHMLNSSTSIPIFEESNNSLDNSSPEFETFSDHTKETRSGNTTTHDNNSLPEYDSFCFEIKPDQERLTSIVKNNISDDSSNDSLLEEVNLFLASDNLIPSGIKNFGYDSEGDICFLEELLIDDSIPFPKNELSDFDHDNSLFPRPPLKPPNVEFDFEPNSGEVISAVMINDELNEDECFDPGVEINVFANVEDDDYFPFIFFIRIFLPYLIYPEVSPFLLSAESEDTIFDPGISV
uniref:Multidrug resistance-associated protein 5 n=1 Tax=Tanacetum cinerariifolium TaxID=118510 RepID=A0A6L2MGN9_TANCI|nr:multidrug resistance-associated protein 5 [Tanacetum cinerariifolium]